MSRPAKTEPPNFTRVDTPQQPAVIQIELDNLHIHADSKRVMTNGTAYISTKHVGRRVKAVIFEEE